MKAWSGLKIRKKTTSLLMAIMLIITMVLPAEAVMYPANLEVTLAPGETVNETKRVDLPTMEPKVDVVFAFDATHTMRDIIGTAKLRALDIINNLSASGVDVSYGVISYNDYPNTYNSYGYNRNYGKDGDCAYLLDQPVTSDVASVTAAINNIVLKDGGDSPENYTRVFYESYSDQSIGWRSGAKKILVNFADAVPHDDNLNEGITSGIWSTGGDPGRDEIMFTEDDLDLQTVLKDMAGNNITLIQCQYVDFPAWLYGGPQNMTLLPYWKNWTSISGGDVYLITSAAMAQNVVDSIQSKLSAPSINNLHLKTSPGYEAWLISTQPTSYSGPTGVSVMFDLTLRVPEQTAPGVYSFTISAVDENNVSFGQQSVTITVPAPNSPPQLTARDVSANEGSTARTTGAVVDEDGDTVSLSASIGTVVNNGDGTWSWSYPTSDGPAESQVVTIMANDGRGGTASTSFNLSVNNVAPKIAPISASLYVVPLGTPVTFSTNFSDPGVRDTHTALWNFGDGTTMNGTVTENGGSGSVSNSYTYQQSGVYKVQLTVTDKDGDFDTVAYEQYVVVYDGTGFVTGGGWIHSPAGAYVDDLSLEGRANFGFVSKYLKGATVPTGQTEFQFKAGNLNFHSKSYEWLVVAGAKAQYKGSGTINGSGDYGFMLTAIDGQINGGGGIDKFRIKIWNKTTGKMIYDNLMGADDTAIPTTALEGGSIVIHKSK